VRAFAVLAGVILLALVATGSAHAAQPLLQSVGEESRHPTAQFGPLAGVDFGAVYLAKSPDRASDGSFLTENQVVVDILTDEEIQSGLWVHENQVDPGTYYALLQALDFECSENPSCIDGFSNLLTVTIPKPAQQYSGRVAVYRFLRVVTLRLRIKPLGENQRYRVCWRLRNGRRRCLRGTVNGYSWGSDASDSVDAKIRGMARRTKFSWYVGSRRVATRTATIPRR
jgi:hypothetical protein